MMKQDRLIIIFVITMYVSKATQADENVATINEYANEIGGNGEYHFRFIQSDGTEKDESGKFEGEGNYVVRGYYSYINPIGRKVYVEYSADNTGYHPKIVDQPPQAVAVYSAPLPPAVVATLVG